MVLDHTPSRINSVFNIRSRNEGTGQGAIPKDTSNESLDSSKGNQTSSSGKKQGPFQWERPPAEPASSEPACATNWRGQLSRYSEKATTIHAGVQNSGGATFMQKMQFIVCIFGAVNESNIHRTRFLLLPRTPQNRPCYTTVSLKFREEE
ncbi:hypothetical protein JTB14_014445 [Gonioctena quinquepunctata]|nr:hypothetical protein JTB14_014445 [Gonioctena quinquepunctata]